MSFNLDNQINLGDGFAYDGNGNPTTYAGQQYTFDQLNHLSAATTSLTGQPNITAGYDGDDLRAWKTDAGGATTYYLDDDDGSPILELSTSGAVLAMNGYGPTGWVARDYPTGSALATTFGAQDYSYTYDPEGNLVQRHPEISAGAAGMDLNLYDAFGNHLADNATATGDPETLVDPVGFGGEYGYYFDKETGKSLLGHRYYDSAYGRFLNRDPIGYNGGINLYGYAGNDPITGSDPSGFDPVMGNELPIGPDGIMYRPNKRGQAPLDKNGAPIDLHHRDQNPDGPIDEWIWGAHRGRGNHSVNHPKKESDVDHGSAWNGWKRRKWREDWDNGRFKDLPVFVQQRNALADTISKAQDWQLAAAAVVTSAVVVGAVRIGIRYIPPVALNVIPRILPAGALRAIPRILPRFAPTSSPLGSPLFGMPPWRFSW